MPNGCFAETRIKGPVLDQMKKGKQLNIVAKGLANNEVTFVLPLAGFGPAFDGPAIPPEVIAKQQQEMQAELQSSWKLALRHSASSWRRVPRRRPALLRPQERRHQPPRHRSLEFGLKSLSLSRSVHRLQAVHGMSDEKRAVRPRRR